MQAFLFLFCWGKIKFQTKVKYTVQDYTAVRAVFQQVVPTISGPTVVPVAASYPPIWRGPTGKSQKQSTRTQNSSPSLPFFSLAPVNRFHFHTNFLLKLHKSLPPSGPGLHRWRMFVGQ